MGRFNTKGPTPFRLEYDPQTARIVEPRPNVGRRKPRTMMAERSLELHAKLRIAQLRLEHARLVAEEREKDRELERYKIEERRRLRLEVEERERIAADEKEAARMLADLESGLSRTRDQVQRSGADLPQAEAEPMAGGRASDADAEKIAREISQVLAGTWQPPPGD